jgi:DNA-directed RNA polymerase subunit RPC12/RpoP
MKTCPQCGSQFFEATQRVYYRVVVDGNNDWERNLGSDDAETPYGPYVCVDCGTEYDEIPTKQDYVKHVKDVRNALLKEADKESGILSDEGVKRTDVLLLKSAVIELSRYINMLERGDPFKHEGESQEPKPKIIT